VPSEATIRGWIEQADGMAKVVSHDPRVNCSEDATGAGDRSGPTRCLAC
jgi:hypothetical protein